MSSWNCGPPNTLKVNASWAALPRINGVSFLCSRCARAPCTCGLCAGKVITSGSITAEIMQLTGLPEEDVLFWSHDNTALTHIPYMICLDR